jgi:hypothetical protein
LLHEQLETVHALAQNFSDEGEARKARKRMANLPV